ncbi:hypothetical protein [Coxiella-like endosymbiont]|uniref:hypothetical protein n=1 Tax=Coxiella-like endosymbiont TaxID=1592897 RepID=UPI00272993F9|nr:hypothetical protein [Coxiella-like endosymbiont]
MAGFSGWDKPLIDESTEGWRYGLLVRSVYDVTNAKGLVMLTDLMTDSQGKPYEMDKK